MSTIQILLLTIIVMMAYARAKPVGHDDTTRRIVKHHSRRHVDNAITAYLAKGMRQGMRLSFLRRLLRRPSYTGGKPITMQEFLAFYKRYHKLRG